MRIDFRLAASLVLLATAIVNTALTVDGLEARRTLRTDLAEISHVRYGVLNADRWVDSLVPILEARIDALDFQPASNASLRSMVEGALYRLVDGLKENMRGKNLKSAGSGEI